MSNSSLSQSFDWIFKKLFICWFHGPRIISAASNVVFWTFFSRQNLQRCLSRLLFLLRWNKYGAKKCLKNHIPFDFWNDSTLTNQGARKTIEKLLKELPWNQQSCGLRLMSTKNSSMFVALVNDKWSNREKGIFHATMAFYYSNNQLGSLVYRVLDQHRLFWHTKEKFRNMMMKLS